MIRRFFGFIFLFGASGLAMGVSHSFEVGAITFVILIILIIIITIVRKLTRKKEGW